MTRASDERFAKWKEDAETVDLLTAAKQFKAVLKKSGQEWVGPCPACNGRDRFSINPGKAKWNCRGHGGGSSVISMAMHIGELSFLEACEELTGEPPPSGHSKPLSESERAERQRRREEAEAAQRRREAEERAYHEDTLAAAARIWGEVQPVAGTLAEVYLHGFKLPAPPGGWPACLGFHPALPYPGKGLMPALVARVDDVAGNLTGVWREFISPDGKKAAVENQKLGLGPVSGGAVRLGGIAPHIGTGEGVRTSIAAWALIGFQYPVWSCLSTSGLVGFEIPLQVERITIFMDGDQPMRRQDGIYVPSEPAGRKAALALRSKAIEAGVQCTVAAEPAPGTDYLNIWQACSEEAA